MRRPFVGRPFVRHKDRAQVRRHESSCLEVRAQRRARYVSGLNQHLSTATRGPTLIAPQHSRGRAALICCGPSPQGGTALCLRRPPVCVRRLTAHRQAAQGGCSSGPAGSRRVGLAPGSVDRRRRGAAASGSAARIHRRDRGPAVPSVRRRCLWLERAGVRWTLAVPLRAISDAYPPARTSSRC